MWKCTTSWNEDYTVCRFDICVASAYLSFRLLQVDAHCDGRSVLLAAAVRPLRVRAILSYQFERRREGSAFRTRLHHLVPPPCPESHRLFVDFDPIPSSSHQPVMARGIEGNEIATPRLSTKAKTGSSQTKPALKQQQSIAGFFQKKAAPASSTVTPAKRLADSNAPKDAPAVPPSSADLPASSEPPSASGASARSSVNGNKENGWLQSPLCQQVWKLTG